MMLCICDTISSTCVFSLIFSFLFLFFQGQKKEIRTSPLPPGFCEYDPLNALLRLIAPVSLASEVPPRADRKGPHLKSGPPRAKDFFHFSLPLSLPFGYRGGGSRDRCAALRASGAAAIVPAGGERGSPALRRAASATGGGCPGRAAVPPAQHSTARPPPARGPAAAVVPGGRGE